jgi:hypothetical protein
MELLTSKMLGFMMWSAGTLTKNRRNSEGTYSLAIAGQRV